MVEYDPRIQDEWITMEKERLHKRVPSHNTGGKKGGCHRCVTLRVAWQNLIHMCGLVCLSISSLLTGAREKTSQEYQKPFIATLSDNILNNISIC